MIAPNGLPPRWSAALIYAEHDFPVVPIHPPRGNSCSCSKGPNCSAPGKHPLWDETLCPNGLASATADPILIRRMAAKWPDANIAIRCDGMVVIDVDGDEGREEIQKLFAPHGGIPETLIQKTSRGGHVFFVSDQADVFKSRTKFRPGLDLRAGTKAYVLMAPSRHVSGAVYQLINKEVEIVDLPPWLAEVLPQRNGRQSTVPSTPQPVPTVGLTAYGRKALDGIVADVQSLADGERNDGFNRLAFRAGQLTEAGHLGEEDAYRALTDSAQAIGLGSAEIEKTWSSGFTSGLANPDPALPRANEHRAHPPASNSKKSGASTMAKSEHAPDTPSGNTVPDIPWPSPLGPAAYHGLVGEIVSFIDPETESDPAAILIQLLACFGSLVGRGPHWNVEAHRHALNLFVVLVGRSSRGRKGTALRHVLKLLDEVDLEWQNKCIRSGLSTGEGLIYHVRDPVTKWDEDTESRVVVDDGVEDKRLLVTEGEFAQPLKVMQREGNTLSPTIRRAWDGEKLSTLTKSNPIEATDTHITIIGHITKEEVLRLLTETEAANGFANRFLWVCVQRSKMLPLGGNFHEKDLSAFVRRLQQAAVKARQVGEMYLSESATALWVEVYEKLSEECMGLFAAAISRAEPQTMRLACLYALLDGSNIIHCAHLEAALEVWRYCEESARYVFGQLLGDPVADRILKALRKVGKVGMTLAEINNALSGHVAKEQVQQALQALLRDGMANDRIEQTKGRPATRWFATDLLPHSPLLPHPPDRSESSDPPSTLLSGDAEKAEEAEDPDGEIRI